MRSVLIVLLLIALPAAGLALTGDGPLKGIDPDLAPIWTPPPAYLSLPNQVIPPQPIGRGPEVVVDTNGNDNYVDADYYGVSNTGTETIMSITFDVSSWSGGVFDLDGSGTYGAATEPVVTSTSGMSASDVTWTYGLGYPQPTTITANISPAMAPGAWFRFGCDTDWFVSDPCPGGNFGAAPASVTATFSSGSVATDDFLYVSSTYSKVTLAGTATFTLSVSPDPLVGGATNSFIVTNGLPNKATFLGYSTVGTGGTYIPPLGVTVDLTNPVRGAGPTKTDASGGLTWTLNVPNVGPLKIWLQAVQMGQVSNVVATSIQ